MRKNTRSKRSENILGEPPKEESNTKSCRAEKAKEKLATTISRGVSAIPMPRRKQTPAARINGFFTASSTNRPH